MKLVHIALNLLIVGLFLTAWAAVLVIAQFNVLEAALWQSLMSLIALFTLYFSLHGLTPDTMIVASYLGHVYQVFAISGKGNRGILGSGVVLIFPPLLTKAYIFPLTLITVPFRSLGAVTMECSEKGKKKERLTAVTVFLTMQLRLAPDIVAMRKFVRSLPVLRDKATNLTVQHELWYFIGMKEDGTVDQEKKWAPCIAKILQKDLQDTVNEAMARSVATVTLTTALLNKEVVEERILNKFKDTVLIDAQLLTSNGTKGAACILFDFNIAGIVPTDPLTAKALSAETTAILNADARIAEGVGEAGYFAKIARTLATQAGQRAQAGEILKKLPANTTLITGPNVVDAIAAQLLGNKKQPPNNP